MYTLRKTSVLTVALALMLALLFAVLGGKAADAQTTDPRGAPSTTENIDPVYIPGNPSCTGLGYNIGYKIDNLNGPFTATNVGDGTFEVTATSSDGVYFDWNSNIGVDAVIVKGGPNSDAFVYDPGNGEVTLDTKLHAPVNPNTSTPFGLSHIEFCYDVEPLVSKTADTSFDRTFTWTIDKAVTPDTWDLFKGDSGTSKYTVSVTKDDGTDSNWAVSGKITVTNPMDDNPMTISGIQDVVTQGTTNTNASVSNCTSNGSSITLPYQLGPKASLECSYSTGLDSGTNGTNKATATSSTSGIDPGTGTAPVDFSKAKITNVNDSITVDDSYAGAGSPWTFSDDGSKSYDRKFTCDGDEGTHDNTATIKETGQSDSAQVKVNCYDLTVSKDADTELTRTYKWTIKKSADKTQVTLPVGDKSPVNYEVLLDATSEDSGRKVSGKITISNPNPNSDATLTSVEDVVSEGIDADVDCPSLTVPKNNGTIECTYSADLPDGTNRTNTATATLQNNDYDSDGKATPSGTTSFTGTANVSFAGAKVTIVDETIDVEDSLQGTLGTVNAADAPKTLTYSRDVGPYEQCGNQKVPNTASFTTTDTGATGKSDWNVDVTVLCKVTVKKTTDGVVNPNTSINFTLTGPGLPSGGITRNTNGDADGILDFGYTLVPGEKYTLCENPVPAGYTSFWQLDGVIVTPYNPGDSKVPKEDLGVRCYDFSASAGKTPAFVIDNSHPGGDPRTIGYWKNWNTCTGGNQAATAAKNGGVAAGVFLLNDLLPQTIGDLILPKSSTGCQQAVKILSKQNLSGKNMASDAAYELASQLLAAKLNLAAGAETCSSVDTAVMNGQALLANGPTDTPKGVNFNGTSTYLPSNTKLTALRTQALSLAATLDKYNNGDLC